IDTERLVFDAGEPIGKAIPQGAHEISRDAPRLVPDTRRSAEIDDVDREGVANLRRAEALEELRDTSWNVESDEGIVERGPCRDLGCAEPPLLVVLGRGRVDALEHLTPGAKHLLRRPEPLGCVPT